MICPKCKAEVNDDAKVCQVCGYKFQESADEKIDAKTFTDVNANEVITSVKSGNLLKKIIGLLFKPKAQWNKIAKEKPKVAMILFGFILILSLLAATCNFLSAVIRNSLYGFNFLEVFDFSFKYSVINLLILIASPIIAAIIVNLLFPVFKTEKKFGRALQLMAYSFTPVYVSWTLYLIPFVNSYIVYFLGLYGILLIWFGVSKAMGTQKSYKVGLFFTSAGILYGVYFILILLVKLLFSIIYYAGAGGFNYNIIF